MPHHSAPAFVSPSSAACATPIRQPQTSHSTVAGRLPYLGLLALYGIALVAIASLTLRERD